MTTERHDVREAADDAPSTLRVGEVLSVGGLCHGRLMALAAAAPADTRDPVDAAVASALLADHPDIAVPRVEHEDVDPARADRRYSLVRIRDFSLADGTTRDLVVMRGELRSVLALAEVDREGRTLLRKNADHASEGGGRPLVIAAAPVGADGAAGPFQMQGFVALHTSGEHDGHDRESTDATWTRVDLWSVSLRYQHWLNVILIFVLSCTGYYIMDPFFGPSPRNGEPTGYLMGWVRLIHFTAAFVWLVVGATRVVSAFTSRDRYLRWPTLWPLKSKSDVHHLGAVVKYYAFLRRKALVYLAHNPLQQLAYTSLYVAAGAQMLTGFVLYGLSHQSNLFWAFVSTPVHVFGIAPIRLFHAMLMFALWAFAIMHIYLAVRADSLERHGGVSSMLNGGVWVRRGSTLVDHPDIR